MEVKNRMVVGWVTVSHEAELTDAKTGGEQRQRAKNGQREREGGINLHRRLQNWIRPDNGDCTHALYVQ